MAIWDSLPTRQPDAWNPMAQAHKDRSKLFATYWDYYRGRHRKQLVVRPNQADDNVVLNYSRRVVNKSVQFLFGKAIDFEIDGTDDVTPQEEYLSAVWGSDEQKMMLLQGLALNGAVCGTAFVRIYPGPDLPRLVNLDPATVDIVVNDDDMDDIRGYHIVWKSGGDWKRQRIDRQESGVWVISEEVSRAGSNRWELLEDEVWPWQFPPLLHCQNLPLPNEVWGISDLENADINDTINFVASNINRILRFHSHPKTIGTGFDASRLQNTAVDQFWTIPQADSKVYNLEMQSDLQSAYAFLQELKQTYAKVTGVPELDPDQVNVGALSGFALRILYGDLLETTRVKRNTYGDLLSDLNGRLLVLANLGDDWQVNNVWQSPLPEDAVTEAATLKQDREQGISLETYLEKRGYDATREMQRIEEEQMTQQQQTDNLGAFLLRSFDRGNGAQ